ncbi:hypothetical protein LDENG_00210220 [Lucifuga dentata]|nr:hypothetical protein LDENG_00210220 [Lucifuga dentata]
MFHKAFGKIFLGRIRKRVNIFGRNAQHYIWREKALQLTPKPKPVKCSGGSIMVCGCFAASGPGQLTIIEGKMNSKLHQIHHSKLNTSWMIQQDKRISKSSIEWATKKKIYGLEWPTESKP